MTDQAVNGMFDQGRLRSIHFVVLRSLAKSAWNRDALVHWRLGYHWETFSWDVLPEDIFNKAVDAVAELVTIDLVIEDVRLCCPDHAKDWEVRLMDQGRAMVGVTVDTEQSEGALTCS